MLLFSMQAHYSPEIQHEQFSFILHPYRTSFTLAHGDYFYWASIAYFGGNYLSYEPMAAFTVDVNTQPEQCSYTRSGILCDW